MDETLSEAWDAYWTEVLTDPDERFIRMAGMSLLPFNFCLDLLRKRSVRRILLPGNGCSLLPHALAHAGYEVTALDISPVASRFIATTQPPRDILTIFTRRRRSRGVGRRNPMSEVKPITPGHLTVVTGDVREWEPDQPFDAIYDDRLMMLLLAAEWPDIAARYARWLGPNGVCAVHTINFGGVLGDDVSGTRNPFEAAFAEAGFQKQELGDAAPEPLVGRLVVFIYGSG